MKTLIAISFLTLLISLFTSTVRAENETILFYSNSCPYCHDVLDAIDEHKINEKIEVLTLESSEEGFQEKYSKYLELCNATANQAGYPTLYHNGECFFGRTQNIDKLLELAEIENTDKVEEEKEDLDVNVEPVITEPLPVWMLIIMFTGPILFIYITYLIIKKLNL